MALTRILMGLGLLAFCGPVHAQAIDADAAAETPTQASGPTLESIHRLQLSTPAGYQLRDSPEYRLQGRWGKPAPLPEAVPPVAKHLPPVDLPYHDKVLAAAEKSGLEPALIHAVIRVESAYNPAAVSPKGAVGLMQLMPDTAKRYGVKNSRDPAENIRGGTEYLIELKQMFDGNLDLVLAAYNAGEKAVIRYGNTVPRFPETIQYIPRVLAEYERLRRLIP
jgi:soluble lytic murein transglycosylase-like protein